jgi:hypothetical protein
MADGTSEIFVIVRGCGPPLWPQLFKLLARDAVVCPDCGKPHVQAVDYGFIRATLRAADSAVDDE